MKKTLLIVAMLAMFVCLLAISVSAATETIDGVTYSLSNGKASVTNANKSCTLETVIIPDVVVGSDGKEYSVTTINQEAFAYNKNVKYISLSKNITWVGAAAFRGMTNLVFVDFNDNPNEITMPGYGVFRDCSSLKAVCLPDGIKSIPDQFMTNCKSLTAVYLPANLEIIRGNQDGGPAFGGSDSRNVCADLFFISKKFSVRDGNGDFYTAETFPVPEKPEVYFFPSTVKAITANHNPNNHLEDENGMIMSGGNSDCGIQFCSGINSVMILPTGYIGYTDQEKGNAILDENHKGDTLSTGLFRGCGNKDNPITVVFLGEIDRVSFDRKDGLSQYTTYVFANPADKGFEDTKIGTWYNTNNVNYSNQNEMYVIFCHANNGLGEKYSIKFTGSAEDNKYPVLVSELQEGAVTHMANPSVAPYDRDATCTEDKMTGIVECYCGNVYSYETIVEGSALGHEFGVENGAGDLGLSYENYMDKGAHKFSCARCGDIGSVEIAALFIDYGYSYTETAINGSFSMSQFFGINRDALAAYIEATGNTVEYGLVVSVSDNPLAEENSDLIAQNKTFITSQDKFKHDYFAINVIGITDGTEEGTKDTREKALTFCAYVIDNGKVYYLDDGKTLEVATQKSYNDILGK